MNKISKVVMVIIAGAWIASLGIYLHFNNLFGMFDDQTIFNIVLLLIFASLVSLVQVSLLKSFSKINRVLLVIGGALISFLMYFPMFYVCEALNPPDGTFLDGLGQAIMCYVFVVANFVILMPILLSMINSLKYKKADIKRYILLVAVLLVIVFAAEVAIAIVPDMLRPPATVDPNCQWFC
ncbi:MAG: hypothetical protein WCI79_02135 [Candidatus Saccharibacteria bacterium]